MSAVVGGCCRVCARCTSKTRACITHSSGMMDLAHSAQMEELMGMQPSCTGSTDLRSVNACMQRTQQRHIGASRQHAQAKSRELLLHE